MTTAIQLITRALNGTGSLAAGEEADIDTANTGLYLLNDLLDSWALDNLLVFQNFNESFPLSSGVPTYSIGVGGVFNTTRPTSISNAYLRVGQNDFPIQIIDDSGYANITTKLISLGYPEYLNYNPSMPNGEISLWPVPQSGQILFIESPKQLTSFPTLTTDVQLAPGYSEAIRLILMKSLAAEGLGKLSQAHLDMGAEAVGRIKTRNSKVPVLGTDRAGATGNIFNGWFV